MPTSAAIASRETHAACDPNIPATLLLGTTTDAALAATLRTRYAPTGADGAAPARQHPTIDVQTASNRRLLLPRFAARLVATLAIVAVVVYFVSAPLASGLIGSSNRAGVAVFERPLGAARNWTDGNATVACRHDSRVEVNYSLAVRVTKCVPVGPSTAASAALAARVSQFGFNGGALRALLQRTDIPEHTGGEKSTTTSSLGIAWTGMLAVATAVTLLLLLIDACWPNCAFAVKGHVIDTTDAPLPWLSNDSAYMLDIVAVACVACCDLAVPAVLPVQRAWEQWASAAGFRKTQAGASSVDPVTAFAVSVVLTAIAVSVAVYRRNTTLKRRAPWRPAEPAARTTRRPVPLPVAPGPAASQTPLFQVWSRAKVVYVGALLLIVVLAIVAVVLELRVPTHWEVASVAFSNATTGLPISGCCGTLQLRLNGDVRAGAFTSACPDWPNADRWTAAPDSMLLRTTTNGNVRDAMVAMASVLKAGAWPEILLRLGVWGAVAYSSPLAVFLALRRHSAIGPMRSLTIDRVYDTLSLALAAMSCVCSFARLSNMYAADRAQAPFADPLRRVETAGTCLAGPVVCVMVLGSIAAVALYGVVMRRRAATVLLRIAAGDAASAIPAEDRVFAVMQLRAAAERAGFARTTVAGVHVTAAEAEAYAAAIAPDDARLWGSLAVSLHPVAPCVEHDASSSGVDVHQHSVSIADDVTDAVEAAWRRLVCTPRSDNAERAAAWAELGTALLTRDAWRAAQAQFHAHLPPADGHLALHIAVPTEPFAPFESCDVSDATPFVRRFDPMPSRLTPASCFLAADAALEAQRANAQTRFGFGTHHAASAACDVRLLLALAMLREGYDHVTVHDAERGASVVVGPEWLLASSSASEHASAATRAWCLVGLSSDAGCSATDALRAAAHEDPRNAVALAALALADAVVPVSRLSIPHTPGMLAAASTTALEFDFTGRTAALLLLRIAVSTPCDPLVAGTAPPLGDGLLCRPPVFEQPKAHADHDTPATEMTTLATAETSLGPCALPLNFLRAYTAVLYTLAAQPLASPATAAAASVVAGAAAGALPLQADTAPVDPAFTAASARVAGLAWLALAAEMASIAVGHVLLPRNATAAVPHLLQGTTTTVPWGGHADAFDTWSHDDVLRAGVDACRVVEAASAAAAGLAKAPVSVGDAAWVFRGSAAADRTAGLHRSWSVLTSSASPVAEQRLSVR